MCPFFAIYIYESGREINPMQMRRNKRYQIGVSDWVRPCYEWMDALIIAVIVLVLTLSFFLRIVNVSGTSMQPNLNTNDKVLLTSIAVQPQYGDVIVAEHSTKSGEPIIKRVIAISGQTVNIDSANGTVLVNGAVLNESGYLSAQVKTTLEDANVKFPVTVPAGKLFVLGDNRAVSLDSRSSEIGLIDMKNVLGKANLVLFPFSHFGKIKGET